MSRPLPAVPVKFDTFPLAGGLDLHTPQLSLKQGVARAAVNYECSINGGYTRIPGYERYSGKPSPTAAPFSVLTLSAVPGGVAVGDTVTGGTSGATGVVAYLDGNLMTVTKVTGAFVAAENLLKVATVLAVITAPNTLVTDQKALANYRLGAANIYRADIAAPAGVGSILGGFVFNGVVYCFRADGGGTVTLYQASGAGWTAVTQYYEVGFKLGSGTPPIEGATVITQGGVTATVKRVALVSGTWATSDAAGKFLVTAPAGGSFAAGALTGGATATLLALPYTGTVQNHVSMQPGGRFEIDIGNVSGAQRVYWSDGVNRLTEFDGTTCVPIDTGMVPDAPQHCKVHVRHLFAQMGTLWQHAAVGQPFNWNASLGSVAFATNLPGTGFLVLPGNSNTSALAFLSNDQISILYGTGATTWQLPELQLGVGSKAYASQVLGQAYIYDDLGVLSLSTVQAYGNFEGESLTQNLRSFLQTRRTLVVDSTINREKSQYRVFYSDGYGLFTTIVNGVSLGSMPVLFPNPVTVCWRAASANGAEVSYFGSTNGMVYQLETGTSFDGAPIAASLDLMFAFQGNSRVLKQYRRGAFEVQGTGYCEFAAGATYSYGDVAAISATATVNTTAAYWDKDTWDNFVWDGRTVAPSLMDINGTAENISIHVESSSALWPTYTLNSLALHYTPRRILR